MNVKPRLLKVALAAVVLIAIVWAIVFLDVRALLTSALEWVSGPGAWGPVVFVPVYVVSTVLMLPGFILT